MCQISNDLSNARPVAVVEGDDSPDSEHSSDVVRVYQYRVEHLSRVDISKIELLSRESRKNDLRGLLEVANAEACVVEFAKPLILCETRLMRIDGRYFPSAGLGNGQRGEAMSETNLETPSGANATN